MACHRRLAGCDGELVLPSCRLSLAGGRLHVVVDGGAAPRPGYLRALTRATKRVAVMQMPDGHHDLAWLTPFAHHLEELLVFDHACQDLSALQRFTVSYRVHWRL